ncbi:hypothetical protein M0R45_023758 [Rubus argutus]|uniref:Uncharacterized protein n=1 Tax=Rubus argutus TaxID=59490 RepID=A0AAW1WQH4_RUBAR
MAWEMRFLNHDVMQKKISSGLQMRINLDNANAIIRFTHSEVIGLGWIESPAPMIYGEPTVVADRGIQVLLSDVKLLSERRRYTEMLAEELSSFGVEEHRQAAIIEDIFREVEVAVPGFQIIVFLRLVKGIRLRGQNKGRVLCHWLWLLRC